MGVFVIFRPDWPKTTLANGSTRSGSVAHHVIPDRELRQNPLLSRADELGIYDFDSAGNGVYLPNNPDAAAVARADPDWSDPTPVHTSGHDNYSNAVASIATRRQDSFEARHGRVSEMSNEDFQRLAPEIQNLIEEIQQDARDLLTNTRYVTDGVLQ